VQGTNRKNGTTRNTLFLKHRKTLTGISSVSAFLRRIDDDRHISGERGRRPASGRAFRAAESVRFQLWALRYSR
jgi:hypothetical protein